MKFKNIFELKPFKASKDVAEVKVNFERQDSSLILEYLAKGSINFSAKTFNPQRKEELWKTTCFELFLSPQGEDNYFEWNFAPSGDWNFYAFKNYRNPLVQKEFPSVPLINTNADALHLKTQVELKISFLDEYPSWRIGLTAVIESSDGKKSWWALEHLSDKPDFHILKSFILKI